MNLKMVIIIVLFLLTFTVSAFGQVVVIANKSVPTGKITSEQLLDFYTGDIRLWNNDKPIVVFDLKAKGEIKEAFYDFLGKSPSRMKSIWLKRKLSGEGDPPKVMGTEEEMLKNVEATNGSIGFIDQAKVTDQVKVLAVIDKK
jgi:ABC-type phosphate transport system substrate-binding protein